MKASLSSGFSLGVWMFRCGSNVPPCLSTVQKIHQKLLSDPDGFPTLQSIVLHEVRNDVALVRNSATEALLWLRRGLRFLKEFLSEVNAGQRDIQGALSTHKDRRTGRHARASRDKH